MYKVSGRLRFILIPLSVFFFISLLLSLIWFKDGLYYGGAEVGLSPYYNPARYLSIQRFIWWSDVAPGMLVPQFINGVPLYLILSIISFVLSPLFIQALLFLLLLFLMGYGMYLFCLDLTGKDKYRLAIGGGLFYMFNSYAMVEVWHRFLYTGFFLASSMPILTLIWRKWIKSGKILFLSIFLLLNLLFSYMYGNLTSLIVIWLLMLIITLIDIFELRRENGSFIRPIYCFFIGFSLFIIVNLWWLVPVFKVSTSVLPEQHTSEDNISTLFNISKQTTLPYLLQMANPFYLFATGELGPIYNSWFFLLLPWIPVVVIFIGLVRSVKNKVFAPFSLLFLIAVIISKGAAPPFGYPYIWSFINIYILGVIRNPFEKLGILMAFFASILFIFGLDEIFNWVSKKTNKSFSQFTVTVIILSIFIYAQAMFTGKVFYKPDYPLKVSVEDSYKKADNWFGSQSLKGNILHLPFPARDVVTYNWEHGYHGVEINELLFTKLPSITRNVGIKRVDDVLGAFVYIFDKSFDYNEDSILHLFQSFNIQYIILHKDTNWQDLATYGKDVRLNNPLEIQDALDRFKFLDRKAVFGELVIYKVKDSFYQPKVVFANHPDLVYPGLTDLDQIITLAKGDTITSINENNANALKFVDKVLIFPGDILYTWEASKDTLAKIDAALPASELNAMRNLFLNSTGEFLSVRLVDYLILANNELLALREKINLKDQSSVKTDLKYYDSKIDDFFGDKFSNSSLRKIFLSNLIKIVTKHLYTLETIIRDTQNENSEAAKTSYKKLNQYLIDNKMVSSYPLIIETEKTQIQRKVHYFNVYTQSTYELLINNSQLSDYIDTYSDLNIQLDGKKIESKGHQENDYISFGQFKLDKGLHEISYNVISSKEASSIADKLTYEGNGGRTNEGIIELRSDARGGSAATTELSGIKGGDVFEISFDGYFENIEKLYIETIEDTQLPDSKDNCSKLNCMPFLPDYTVKGWKEYSFKIVGLNLATRKASLRFLLPNSSNGFSQVARIKNLKVDRVMDNSFFLRRQLSDRFLDSSTSAQILEFRKESPVKYNGKMKLGKAEFMLFKETFNPDWALYISGKDGKQEMSSHFLGNQYSNAYLIEKAGEYNFTLEFTPQKYVDLGIIFSVGGWVLVVALLIFDIRKKND